MFSMMMGGEFPSMSFSDIDDLLPDLSDGKFPDLLLLRFKKQAARAANAAPTKMQPIAMPTVWPRESPELSADEGEVVCTWLDDISGASMVDEGVLVGIRDVDVKFGDITPDDMTGVVKADVVAVSLLIVAASVEENPGDALFGGFKCIVSSDVPLKMIAVGAGRIKDVRFASRSKVTGVTNWPVARTHG